MMRGALAVETASVFAVREGLAPALAWLLGLAGLALPLLPAAPVVRTAYVGFVVVIALLLWLRWRGEDWANFGLKAAPGWVRTVLVTLGITLACVACSTLLNPLFAAVFGNDNVEATFAELAGDTRQLLISLPLVWLFAAFGEEVFYRGYLMIRLQQLLGEGRWSWALANLGQAVLFAAGHGYQGLSGALGVGVYALLYGYAVRLAKGSLVPAMLVHGILDTIGFVMLYAQVPV